MKTLLPRVFTWPVAWFLVILSLLSSCQKDGDPSPKGCRLTKFYDMDDPTQYTIYQFDNQNRIVQLKAYYKGKEQSLYTYEYNAPGQLTKATERVKYLNWGGELYDGHYNVYTLEYNAQGQVTRYLTTQPEGQHPDVISETICEYNNEGNRIKTTFTNQFTATPYVSYYSYENGNCVKAIINQGQENERTHVYAFDLTKEDKLREFDQASAINNLLGPNADKNMIKSETITYGTYTHANASLQYWQEYNDQGYPIKLSFTSTTKDGSYSKTRILEYDCQ